MNTQLRRPAAIRVAPLPFARRLPPSLWLAALALVLGGCSRQPTPPPGPKFSVRHAWLDDGAAPVWLKADTHFHSVFSDGSHENEWLVEQAQANGCDVVAVTDHADGNLRGAGEEYFAALRRARRQFPEMIVLAGLEWNVPPHGGDEHVTVIVEPTADEELILAEFKSRFDDLDRDDHAEALAVEGLAWLTGRLEAAASLGVVIYNHPGRKRDAVGPFADEFRRLRAASPLLVGFEGAPGHQAGPQLGAYKGAIQLQNRWDPVVAVGGPWDRLLGEGVACSGAASTSDFHNQLTGSVMDYLPGKFSETWIQAPKRTARGALQGLAAGAFFGAQGQIVREATLTATATGLPRPAYAGETIAAPIGTKLTVQLHGVVPQADWQGEINALDEVDFVTAARDGSRVAATVAIGKTPPPWTTDLVVPEGGVAVRAVGRRKLADGGVLQFLTNAVRIEAE